MQGQALALLPSEPLGVHVIWPQGSLCCLKLADAPSPDSESILHSGIPDWNTIEYVKGFHNHVSNCLPSQPTDIIFLYKVIFHNFPRYTIQKGNCCYKQKRHLP